MTGPAAPGAGAPVRFNPFGAAFRRDPYPQYAQLRTTRPVHRTLGMWVVTRHADVRDVLHDRSFSAGLIPSQVADQAARLGQGDVDRIVRLGRTSLVFTDNPAHARLRGLVNRAFTAPAVARLRSTAVEIATKLIQPAWAAGSFDVIEDFAGPLPIAVLCAWLDLPAHLHGLVGPWTHDIRFLLEPGLMKAADLARVREVVEEFGDALRPVLADRRVRPGDDLISGLLAARTAGGDSLSEEEVIFLCIMCFVAGTETTKSLIGNAVLALVRHPEQQALLRARPELLRAAVIETLRYDCPLQLTKRLATREVEIGGERVAAGDQVLVCLGAANRDPEIFDRPDEFDLTRDGGAHLAFGHGIHGCLGGILAELQTEIALERLYRDSTELTPLGDEFDWQDHSFILRGVRTLPASIRRAR
ncbi:cytochrome P450 [Nocardia sp. alder85J]|uniref:cytochrome P450 n=1 Tax=Nocardia sp. alder85J TaxID=2862949 RepID=UPI001CD1B326|nr:cytochrome P450 [Nocardia sp. alder85J]MCX4091566.1 cytochrome P450 [Nocardia sp. alder85J]